VWVEFRVPDPMFKLRLFRIRAFTAGNIAGALGATGRGGLQFVLIIWLQGIWLPLHGYSFAETPLWAGIYMIPLTVGFLAVGPVSGILSDRFGARPFATAGLAVSAAAFLLMNMLPIDFGYPAFAALILTWALGTGLFMSPNQAGVMNSLPPDQRGAGAGMLATFQNSAQVLSMGAFFTVITLGLAASLPSHLYSGLVAQGVPAGAAKAVAGLPPIGTLFAAFLGYNAIQIELGHSGALAGLPHAKAAYLTGRQFFPRLISAPFANGLHLALLFAAGVTIAAAVASLLRGGVYFHQREPLADEMAQGMSAVAEVTGAEVVAADTAVADAATGGGAS
ncbi:MAG TPA: MFS transporter, partial [Acidimicrobiales bacterium]|nr:MFS transporter [Acidimicrobiales bacterium]